MNKEQFIALGFTDDQAAKAATASQDELKSYIPKARFDEVNESKKKLEKDLGERDTQLETLKKTAGDSETLKQQIETLQNENKAAQEKHEADMRDLKLGGAIQAALTGQVHDEALVTGLIDKAKLVIDGDKIVGLEEQVKGLRESKSFLFKPLDEPGAGGASGNPQGQTPPAGFKIGGNGTGTPPSGKPASLTEAIAARFSSQS